MRAEKLYLSDIQDSVEAIARFLLNISYIDFTEDEIRQAAILQKLIIIGEAASHLPDDFRERHDNIPWQDIIGFRNFAIHEYFSVDWEIVWTTATEDVPLLGYQIAEILPLYS